MDKIKFQSLLPRSDVDLSSYKDALDFSMNHDEIRNIALSGSYGSGKSSVINSYEKICEGKKFLHISLASFSKNEQKSNQKETVNHLEGKILNQLIHQLDPKTIRQSQFCVKTNDEPHQKLISVIFCTVFIFILLYTVRFDAWKAFVATLPPGPFDISWTACPSVRVVTILICFFMGGLALYRFVQSHDLQRIFKKLDVKGIVGIEIFENTDESFFDKYLNEVLYLFEQSEADAIVFEDLDRYDVIEIFEKLKEVSDLLYQRKKRTEGINISKKPSTPKFFYLIRDDVFSSSDRSKFFDFIIPIVPIIATDNAHSLMQERLSELGLQDIFNLRFLRAVSLYLTDLRLINNIVNEYTIYNDLLGRNNLQRDPNRQLAIIIYKNLFPKDFEQLQRGTGYLYSLFAERETLLGNQRAELDMELQRIKQRLEDAHQEHLRSIDELNGLFLPNSSTIYTINGSAPSSDLNRADLIKELLSAKSAACRNSYGIGNIDINHLREQMESDPEYQRRKTVIEDQDTKLSNRLQFRLDEINQELHQLNTKKLCEILTSEDDFWLLESLPEKKKQEFSYITSSREFNLLKYLIQDGYIDENYPIYISYFYPNSLSVRDKNFLLALTSHKMQDYTYPLDSPELVLEWIDESYFTLAVIGNFALFNFILEQKKEPLLKIWLDALDCWCDISGDAFDFPIALWRCTPHRNYLVQVINKTVPHWFKRWTDFDGLLSDREWHQYTIDTLLNCDERTLVQMNEQDWLSKAIAQRSSFLQIDGTDTDAEKLVHALCILEVHFVDLGYRDKDLPLLKHIYQKNLYELNANMLKLWLSVFYDIPNGDELEKSYTYLLSSPDEPLSLRVEKNFKEYLSTLLEQSEVNFSDVPQAVITILNRSDIDAEDLKRYVCRLDTKLEKLYEIKQKELWPMLVDKDCIVFYWENVIDYYMEYCKGALPLDNHLVNYLQRGNLSITWTWGMLLERIGEDEASILYQKLIQCTTLSTDRYREILQPLKAFYNSFTIKSLPAEHINIIIELGVIPVTSDNVKFMRSAYPNQLVNFLMQDGGEKFTCMAENSEISMENRAELTALLEDERMEDTIAMRLLDLQSGTLPLAGKKYSEIVQVKIIEGFFNVEDINWFLMNLDNQSASVRKAFCYCMREHIDELREAVKTEELIPISVYAYTLQAMTPEVALELRQFLPNKDFELVCTTNRKPKFRKTKETQTILEYFKTQNWISSYRLLPSGEYQAFSKQRKIVEV